jgi:predicted TIM-barrel enzyme
VNEQAGVVGFVGASSLERLAFEQSLPALTRRFKSIPVGRRT